MAGASVDARVVRRVGRRGPLVPCLPVITGRATTDQQLYDLRVAMVDAVLDPLVEPAARAMCTVGFTPLDLDAYLPILDLAPAPR